MRIHDCECNVTVCGEGNNVVLLHGWGQSSQRMAFIQEALKDNYCVVNLDLAGFGKSAEPNYPWRIEDYSDALHELLTVLKMEKPIIIGHSFGARIALYYAYKYPCQGLILTGAAGIRQPRTINYYLKVYAYKLLKHFKQGKKMGSLDYQNASPMMKKVLVQCVNEDLSEILPYITTNTLLTWGKQDEVTPCWMGKKMEQLLPNAYFIPIKGGHFAYYRNEHFIKIIQAYLKEAYM